MILLINGTHSAIIIVSCDCRNKEKLTHTHSNTLVESMNKTECELSHKERNYFNCDIIKLYNYNCAHVFERIFCSLEIIKVRTSVPQSTCKMRMSVCIRI